MRTPLQAWRNVVSEFSRVMGEHEAYLLSELAPGPDRTARARAHRAERAERPAPGTPADNEGPWNANE